MDLDDVQQHESLDEKVSRVYGNLAIDKRRLPQSQLSKRGIPAYVAEWVIDSIIPGKGSLTDSEKKYVQEWAAEKIPGAGEQKVIKWRLSQGETVKVLTPVETEVRLRKMGSETVAHLRLLGLEGVGIPDETLEEYPALLRQGMWGVTEVVYTTEGPAITGFRPMQASLNIDVYKRTRQQFTLGEWRSLLVTSMGYNPETFTESEQLILLMRLLPLVQKNMHLMELAPKGTGKSYLFENISPKVRLISGGNVSPAVLFVNNSTKQWGLLARFSVVVLDEVQTLKFQEPEEIIGGLKGYLANGRLSRGGLMEAASDCGLVLLANILLDERQRPVHDLLVDELPDFLRETAFLDRMRGIIPGWKTQKLSSNSFASSVGLKADFFGDALLALRDDLACDQYVKQHVNLTGEKPYKRNEEAIHSIASGLMKILFPDGEVSTADFGMYCVQPAIEMRQLIWDQLYKLDSEYRQYERAIGCDVV